MTKSGFWSDLGDLRTAIEHYSYIELRMHCVNYRKTVQTEMSPVASHLLPGRIRESHPYFYQAWSVKLRNK